MSGHWLQLSPFSSDTTDFVMPKHGKARHVDAGHWLAARDAGSTEAAQPDQNLLWGVRGLPKLPAAGWWRFGRRRRNEIMAHRKSTSAERMRRFRKRRREGVISVIQLEVLETDIAVLIAKGCLHAVDPPNRSALEDAVTSAYEMWLSDA